MTPLKWRTSRMLSLGFVLATSSLPLQAADWQSAQVQAGADGRLAYATDSEGNRVPDYSHAGYKGGGVPLPDVPVVKTIVPVEGDNTAHIQAALDEVGALPLKVNGYRGALQLAAGVYEVLGTVRIRQSGVVLTGVGHADDPATNTIIRRTGTSTADVITAGGTADDQFRSEIANTRRPITTAFVGVGSRSFDVEDVSIYSVGDNIVIWHPSTQAWIDAVDRGGVTDANYWRAGDLDIRYHRYVTAIAGNTITVDAPVFNHLERSLSQSVVYKFDRSGVVENLGVENLQIEIITAGETAETHAKSALRFLEAEDSWVRDCTMKHFWYAGVEFAGSTRCTAERVRALEPHSIITGGRRYNFTTTHSQLILFNECHASHARHAFVANGTTADSGIVALDCTLDQNITFSEGHRRWSTGLLFDGCVATNRSGGDVFGFYNRGTYGTGHGWGAAHSVIWRCDSAGGRILVQKPPTAQNYAIGCIGNVTGDGPFPGPVGLIEGANEDGLLPRSLYRAQLDERLGRYGSTRILASPAPLTAAVGTVAAFQVEAAGRGPLVYQWVRDGVDIEGATRRSLVFPAVRLADAGSYSVRVSGPEGTVASAPVDLVATPQSTARLVNISSRGTTSFDGDPLIAGFVVSGATRAILARGMGPTLALAPFHVTGTIGDPAAMLYDAQGQLLVSNDNWPADLAATMADLGAFPPQDPREAALLHLMPAAPATVMVRPSSGSGIVLAEIYDAGDLASPGHLVNLSTRARVGIGDAVLIAGFVIVDGPDLQVLIRAVGPSLATFDINIPEKLTNPQVTLFAAGATDPIAFNDNWWELEPEAIAAAAVQIGAFPLLVDGEDSALLTTLSAGGYTAIVSGVGGGQGTALVEIYDVDG